MEITTKSQRDRGPRAEGGKGFGSGEREKGSGSKAMLEVTYCPWLIWSSDVDLLEWVVSWGTLLWL